MSNTTKYASVYDTNSFAIQYGGFCTIIHVCDQLHEVQKAH